MSSAREVKMYALADINACYSSCEKAFDPSIRDKPVIVLSNNDGAVVSACNIAKRAGVGKKFVPYFQVKEELKAAGAIVRSSNYELYADLSSRMMDTLVQYAADLHIYSIDEAFMAFGPLKPPGGDWFEYGRRMRRTVWDEVRLPIGVGIGPTPTLAKAASHASKRLPGYRGVATITDEQSRRHILKQMDVDEVWGIGPRLKKRFNEMGVVDALTLSEQNPRMIRRQFSRPVEDTVRELAGEPRLTWDDVRSPKKAIFSTRSMGQRIVDSNTLRQALSFHAELVGRKLRRQKAVTGGLMIFASSSPHDKEPFYRRSLYHGFAVQTSDTREFNHAISQTIDRIFKSGVRFYRCGVGVIDINNTGLRQPDLFEQGTNSEKVMNCLDTINAKYGRGTIHLAAQGLVPKYAMRRQLLSPQFTTRWSDIPKVRC